LLAGDQLRHRRDDRMAACCLLIELEVRVVVVMMMVAGMDDHYDLRLRRIGNGKAEGEDESEQNLFHNSVCSPSNQITELL
jgi:hypothetical protein